jgi:hypothetical protein
MTRIRIYVLLSAFTLVAFIAALVAVRATSHSAVPAPAAAVRTTFPGLLPAAAEPQLPGLDQLSPAPGTVVQAPGPFDDRLALDSLTFDSSGVHGSALVVSDVSDILEFEALAGFYDEAGRLLGTGRFVYHLDESAIDPAEHSGPPNELEEFSIPLPAGLGGRAVSAAVGVPVLVNE